MVLLRFGLLRCFVRFLLASLRSASQARLHLATGGEVGAGAHAYQSTRYSRWRRHTIGILVPRQSVSAVEYGGGSDELLTAWSNFLFAPAVA